MRTSIKLQTFMQICRDLSCLSHDPKIQVATIIITDNFKEICSIGYNGDYSGGPNIRSNMTQGQSSFLHSEENALFHLGKPLESREHLILICTHKPCSMCAKRIVNSGIKRVVYDNEYNDSLNQTDEIFLATNVKCFSFNSLLSSKEKIDAYFKYAICENR